jgi:hypothetical protein
MLSGPIAIKQRLELLALIAEKLSAERSLSPAQPQHSLLELRGLGTSIWERTDAQEHMNGLRDEWTQRSP